MSGDTQPQPQTSSDQEQHGEPVLIRTVSSQEEADVLQATLEAVGIPGIQLNPGSSGAGTLSESVGDTWTNAIYVPAQLAEQARAALDMEPTEAELVSEFEADPRTLEEAEAEVQPAPRTEIIGEGGGNRPDGSI
jgi:hypothetical protein